MFPLTGYSLALFGGGTVLFKNSANDCGVSPITLNISSAMQNMTDYYVRSLALECKNNSNQCSG